MNRFRISPDNPVRRRLFEFDDTEEASIDNFANVLQEDATRVKNEKKQKWNFDFENEIPLDGPIQWMPCEGPLAYTGRLRSIGDNDKENSESRVKGTEMDVDEENATLENAEEEFYEESAHLLRQRNETTPGKKKEDIELLKTERRRGNRTEQKTGNHCNDKAVRRNINFE